MAAKVDPEKCEGCGDCVEACPSDAIKVVEKKAVVQEADCIDCSACEDACPQKAITPG